MSYPTPRGRNVLLLPHPQQLGAFAWALGAGAVLSLPQQFNKDFRCGLSEGSKERHRISCLTPRGSQLIPVPPVGALASLPVEESSGMRVQSPCVWGPWLMDVWPTLRLWECVHLGQSLVPAYMVASSWCSVIAETVQVSCFSWEEQVHHAIQFRRWPYIQLSGLKERYDYKNIKLFLDVMVGVLCSFVALYILSGCRTPK